MMSISGGVVAAAGAARVPIPSSLRKTINDIKEIAAGKHSDDDIYAMLKECNMDPNETAQRLLYLDTFHEVKRKRDKKKVIDQAPEGYRRVSGMQRQGARGDYGGKRHVTARQENGGMNNYGERKTRPSATVVNEREKIAAPSNLNSTAVINAAKNASNGGFSHETASRVAFGNINNSKFASAAKTNLVSRVPPLPNIDMKHISSSNPGPSAPTPTNTSTLMPEIRYEGVVSASESGVYSSASDPILVPSLSPRNPGSVGTIKREKGTMGNATEYISDSGEARQNVGQDSASEIILSSSKTGPSIIPQDDQLAKQTCGPSKVMASQAETIVLESNNTPSLPQLNDSVLDHLTPELDRKLKKLSISAHRPVIFPDHLQVPEALRKALTFGSLDTILGQSANSENISMPTSEIISATDLAVREHSKSNHYASSTHGEGENSNCPPSHPQVTKNSSTPGDITASGAASKYDQPKQDLLAPIGESQYPLLQTAPEFGFGFAPHVLGPHFMHQEGSEQQVSHSTTPSSSSSTPPVTQPSGLGQSSFAIPSSTTPSSSSSTPPVTQPSGLGQSSFAIPPHLLPFIRQPYPPNFIPYNPYFPHLYMPHTAHQFFGHGVLPQQPTPGNIYVPPVAAAGVKFPVSPLYKSGTIAGNLPHYGIPSGYGSYGASTIGYSPNPAFTSSSGSSGGNEDLVASELKEKNTYSALKQNDEPHAWTSAAGRDISPLQANYVYNIPPGQHVGFSPAHSGPGPFSGVYHLNHTLAPSSTIPPLPKQSQAAAGSVESVVPASSYQQPHSQINWNTQILNRENV